MNTHYEWRMPTVLRVTFWGVYAVCFGSIAVTTDDTFVRIVDAAAVVLSVVATALEVRRRGRRGPSSTDPEMHNDHAGPGASRGTQV